VRGALSSVTFRVLLVALLVVGLAGAALDLDAERRLDDFARQSVARVLLERRDDLRRICEDAYGDLLRDGREDNEKLSRLARARTIARIEEYARDSGLHVAIDGGGVELLRVAGPGGAGAVQELELTFAPWQWRIRVARGLGEYAGLIRQLRRHRLVTGVVLLLVVAALVLPLDRAVGGPLRAIARAVREKREPPARGVGEVRFLGESIAAMMRELEAERRALDASLAALARAQEIARLGSWEWDTAGGAISWSAEVRRILGLPADAAPSLEQFLALVHPDDRARVAAAVGPGAERGPFEIEYRVVRPDGAVRSVVSRAEFAAAGAGSLMTGTIHDVTERARIEEELRRAHNLEALGLLAGGIAHDFNNLLTGLLGNIELARDALPPGAAARGFLDEAARAHELASKLTRQFVTFARGGAPQRRRVELSSLVVDAVRFTMSGSSVRSAFELPAEPVVVEGDEGQLTQVFQNLAVNARDAMPAGGVFTVALRVVDAAAASLPAGRCALVTLADTGVGIPAGMIADIFTPYFTTKGAGGPHGKGLGLATCHSIVKRHGGHIRVESVEGRGTTFSVWLPGVVADAARAGDAAAAPAPAPAASPVPPAGQRRVLVMDDEKAVRDVVAAYLRQSGYEVTAAAHGAEAVELFAAGRREGRPFGAVILDLTVPGGMGGEEAAAKILEVEPSARVILASGYAERARSAAANAALREVIAKPFAMRSLGELLERPAPPRA
jgi:PAS domain S-box-containing protein